MSTQLHLYQLVFDGSRFSQFAISLHLKRCWTFYFTKMILIAVLILLLAVPSFYLTPADLGCRGGFILSLFIAIVAHNYVVSTMLPKVSYLTALDYIMTGSQLLLCLAALEHLCVYYIAVQGGNEPTSAGILRARKVDRLFIYVYPVVVLLFPLAVWLLSTT